MKNYTKTLLELSQFVAYMDFLDRLVNVCDVT